MKTSPLAGALPALALSLSSTVAAAQQITPLVLEGDAVIGVGNVTSIDNLAIHSAGDWYVEVDTDHANTDADGALLGPGGLVYREGQALPLPVGATLNSFDGVSLNASGHGGFNHFLSGTAGANDDSGVYWDDHLLVQEGMLSTAAGFSAGTPYVGFFEARVNDADTVLVMASVDDPLLSSTVDRAIVLLATDGAGNLLSETVLRKEGDLVGSGGFPATDFGTGPHSMDINDLGQVLYVAQYTGPGGTDYAIYVDGTLLAEELAPSPVPGRNWSSLASPELSLNNTGGWVFSGSLDGDTASNLLIERSGAKFRQEGDTLPAIAPFLLTGFGSGPVDIADDGRVLWYGDWDDPDTNVDTGLFLDDTLLVQEGVTTIGGLVVDTLSGVQDGYAISDDGRWVIFEATLVGGISGAFLIDLAGPGQPYCFGDGSGVACPCGNAGGAGEGCANSSGVGAVLASGGSASVAADDLTLAASALLPNRPALLFAGQNQPGAGLGVLFGDGLRCAGGGVVRLGVRVPNAGGAASWGPGLGASGGWSPTDVRNFQVWYRDPVGSPCGSAFNLSNGLSVTFEL